MKRPHNDEEELQNLAQLPLDQLRPDFVDKVKKIRTKILSEMKTKKLNGRCLTGAMIARLAE
jgi:hypothetical protein